MKHRIFSGLIFLLAINFPQLTAGGNAGTTGLSFLKLGASSRAVGMGEAYVAIANDASATYWNAAGLVELDRTELLFTHNKWVQDITNEFAALGFRWGKSAFGVSFMSSTIEGIERRVIPSTEPVDVLTAHDIMFGLSFARKMNEKFNIGTTVKFLYQKIYVEQASGLALDVGTQWSTPMKGLKAGLAFQNFGFMSKLKTESTKLPQTIRLGLAYHVPFQIGNGGFLVESDWVKILDSTSHFNFGVEFSFINYLSARFGYQTGFESKGIHAGFGVGFNRYRLDYAYVPLSSDLGNSHRISVGIGF